MEKHALRAPDGARRRRKRVAAAMADADTRLPGAAQKDRSPAPAPAYLHGLRAGRPPLCGDCRTGVASAMPVFASFTNRSTWVIFPACSQPVPR